VIRWLRRAAFLIGVAACETATLDPLPLSVEIEASRTTAAPGDTITFVVSAQGGSLAGVAIAFGDNSTAQFATGGARTAEVAFRHAYTAVGVYAASATVTDALAGDKTASVEIRVE
jgi:plastocyanin